MIANMIHYLRPLSLCFLLATSLMACTPTIANRGNMVEEEKLAEIKTGESSREDVARILGTPTQVSTFDENTWYYFGRSTKQYAFLDPEVVAQQALEIYFDDTGIVSQIKKLDPTEAQEIAPVARRTPTYGHETTILEQLVGNLGKPAGLAGKEGKK